jgi:hypothetical protein
MVTYTSSPQTGTLRVYATEFGAGKSLVTSPYPVRTFYLFGRTSGVWYDLFRRGIVVNSSSARFIKFQFTREANGGFDNMVVNIDGLTLQRDVHQFHAVRTANTYGIGFYPTWGNMMPAGEFSAVDIGGVFYASGGFIAPVDGLYEFSGGVEVSSSLSSSSKLKCRFDVDGTFYESQEFSKASIGPTKLFHNLTISLEKGASVLFEATCNDASVQYPTADDQTFFKGRLLTIDEV